jgi:hypothetical protein
VAECGLEFIIRKRTTEEIAAGGRWQRTSQQPDAELRVHLNQHRADLETLKQANGSRPPFTDSSDL